MALPVSDKLQSFYYPIAGESSMNKAPLNLYNGAEVCYNGKG
jgi:hypothetical protein